MTTDAQLDSFGEHPKKVNLDIFRVIENARNGMTYDEAWMRYDGSYYGHAEVDSFRVQIRWLREEGYIKDSGEKRLGFTGRKQTVWIAGDDRAVVRAHRITKLHKLAKKLGYIVTKQVS